MIKAIYTLARNVSKPPNSETRSTARLQTVSLDNLKLNSAGSLDPIVYHTWKHNIISSTQTMKLEEPVVLQLLRTKSHLPDKVRDTIQHAESLSVLFSRIEKQTPELESAVTTVIKRICGLKPCSTESHAVEARATELILAIQDLTKLFPTRELNKSEALMCLASLQHLDPHIMAMAKKWSTDAAAGGAAIKNKLSEYIDSVREMCSEARFAISVYGHESSAGTRSHLQFTRSGDQGATGCYATGGVSRRWQAIGV